MGDAQTALNWIIMSTTLCLVLSPTVMRCCYLLATCGLQTQTMLCEALVNLCCCWIWTCICMATVYVCRFLFTGPLSVRAAFVLVGVALCFSMYHSRARHLLRSGLSILR